MALKKYQFEMNLNTIYSLDRFDDLYDFLNCSLFVLGGAVNVYTSEEQPASVNDMLLEDENIVGHNQLETIPEFIYFEQSIATVEKIIITGVKPVEV